MIRYLLAAVLAVALLALSVPAIDYAATENTDRQVESEIDSIETAADSLIENEEIPPEGQQRPLRTVEVSLPGDSLTTESVDTFEIERVAENVSRVTYVVEGQSRTQTTIDVPIVYQNPYENRTLEIGGSGDTELDLILAEDENGIPVAVATRDGELEGEPPDPPSFDVSVGGTGSSDGDTDSSGGDTGSSNGDTDSPDGERETIVVDEGDPVEIDVQVVNSGDEVDTQAVDLEIDGLGSDAEEVELGPGERTTVTLSVDTESGYRHTEPGELRCVEETEVTVIDIFGIIQFTRTECVETARVGGTSEWRPSDDVGEYEATITSENTIEEIDVRVREDPS